jgi:hypothetical protein
LLGGNETVTAVSRQLLITEIRDPSQESSSGSCEKKRLLGRLFCDYVYFEGFPCQGSLHKCYVDPCVASILRALVSPLSAVVKIKLSSRPCHSACANRRFLIAAGLASIPGQFLTDLWWTKWHWGRFSRSNSVPPVNSNSTKCFTRLCYRAGTMRQLCRKCQGILSYQWNKK